MRLEKNEIHTVTIEGYNTDGLGICRLDGAVVFVPQTVRGDECEIRIVKVLKNVAYGKVEKIITPSEHRVEPNCPVFAQCGGCDFLHMSYEEELHYKKQRVYEALTRVGGVECEELEIVPSPTQERYRNKAIFPCTPNGAEIKAGFYRSHSHDVVECSDCKIQTERANSLRDAVLEWAKKFTVPAYNEVSGNGLLRQIYVRTGEKGSLLTLVINGRRVPYIEELVQLCRKACTDLRGVVLNTNKAKTNRVVGDKFITIWGEGALVDGLCGVKFAISPRSFYQINHGQAENLYTTAIEFAGFEKTDKVLDLYCGIGTLTLLMASHCESAMGVEIVLEAAGDAEENARRNNITNAKFMCADANRTAELLEIENFKPDVLVTDPPRKGMDAKTIEAIVQIAPKKLVYVSCDPATLARDVKIFTENGFEFSKIKAFDMFPKTANVECCALLVRK